MAKIAKPVTMTFVRGPLHLIQAKMSWIPEVNMVVDGKNKIIHAYRREELVYWHDPELSKRLSEHYDAAVVMAKRAPMEVTGEAPKKNIHPE